MWTYFLVGLFIGFWVTKTTEDFKRHHGIYPMTFMFNKFKDGEYAYWRIVLYIAISYVAGPFLNIKCKSKRKWR